MTLQRTRPAHIKTSLVQPAKAKHEQNKLPFLIETKAINKWLDTIALKQPVQETNEIYIALKIIIKHPDEYHQHLSTLLPLISPVIVQLSQHLEHLFSPTDKNLNDKKRKIARLSINTLRYLAILYQNLSTDCDHPTQLAQYFNNCLQISYLCLRQNALIYERPSNELWKIIGKIYQVASAKGILNLKIKDLVTSYRKQNCITENLKAILLFSHCKPYHLQQAEIIRLCYLLDQHNDKLTLTNQQSENCLFCWDYTSSFATQISTPNTDIGFSTLFLDSHLLVPILRSETFPSIADSLAGHPSLTLSLSQSEATKKTISTGFATVLTVIEQLDQNKKINKSSVQSLSITDKFELHPFEYEQTAKNIHFDEALQNKNSPCLLTEVMVKEKADIDFVLIELASFPGNAEDLVIICDNENCFQLGIIRRLRLLKNKNYQILAEVINSEVNIITLTNQKSVSKALFCKIADNSTSILITSDKYTTGSSIQITNQSYNLTRLFDFTSNYLLYQLEITD